MSGKNPAPLRVSDLAGALAKLAPWDWAESWDNVGHLIGDAQEVVRGVIVSVNACEESFQAAKAAGANVIVCHHPPIFKPISKVTKSSAPLAYECLKNGLNVIALHTNFDLASEALNKSIASKLGATYAGPLILRGGEAPRSNTLAKFATFLPSQHIDELRAALSKAGAGKIGDYESCSFSVDGIGTFRGGATTNPSLGLPGQLEKVDESRFEMIFPLKNLEKIVSAAKAVHPYEEMAFDVVKLEQSLQSLGYGFVGNLQSATSFQSLLQKIKEIFELDSVTVVGPGLQNRELSVKKIAFSPGSGSSFIGAAVAKGVNLYLCGEVGYHQMLEAKRAGITLIILGHSYSERFFVETVALWCEDKIPGRVGTVFETVHKSV